MGLRNICFFFWVSGSSFKFQGVLVGKRLLKMVICQKCIYSRSWDLQFEGCLLKAKHDDVF